ncbi:MAG: TIGR03936 family radical SAM-associated protein [Treponemataceae bacterium]|nr:TIGR03936 family radical SAM-associated protein [Treponemataceae bacterium]
MTHIDPLKAFGDDLAGVQNPAKYLGKDFGQTVKADGDVGYTYIMAFPDMYEIGMSNQAIKILYNGINTYDDMRAERVFAPDTDFEALLKEKNVPLYSLESGIPLNEADCIGFSIGYELGISGVLGILDCGRIPLCAADRGENDPIIIAGGCGATNPAPFAKFFDAVFIGEAENEFFEMIHKMAVAKKAGASRKEQIAIMAAEPAVWMPGKQARRAIQADFGQVPSVESFLPVANIKPVQDHGVIEIMRGCPNGCRFCHAGVYYRPQRVKTPRLILEEADRLIEVGGFREISLTSLSSADYPDIERTLDILMKKYEGANISFQLPSLKVNSFSLPLLEKLSTVRKSGLTFAVETPVEMWQLALNKEVYAQRLVEIILEAKKRGWSSAKFYFMVGLPPACDERHGGLLQGAEAISEEKAIVDFLLDIQERTRIQCSVNVGTYIPKAHTPYERVRQLTIEESREKMEYIRSHLPRGKFKVSTHNPFVSFIEGLISRGDERVGDILLSAYKKGCRLDAWEDKMEVDIWNAAIAEAPFDVVNEITRARSDDEILPWHEITLGPPPAYYKREFDRSTKGILTTRCSEDCKTPCGVCSVSKNIHSHIESNCNFDDIPEELLTTDRICLPVKENNIDLLYRCLFTYEKKDGGEYLPHLATQENLHKAFLRTGLPIMFSNGFNPIPVLELASTLSLGIESAEEFGSCLFRYPVEAEEFIKRMETALTPMLKITGAIVYPVTRKVKRVSLSAKLFGAEYRYTFKPELDTARIAAFFESDAFAAVKEKNGALTVTRENDAVYRMVVPFACDRPLRDALAAWFDLPLYKIVHIFKLHTLAVKEGGAADEYGSYYDCFETLQKKHQPHLKELFEAGIIEEPAPLSRCVK